ncbi:MAG: phosphoribosylformylglycinamidine synthase subunit PurL [Planctomycetes bacterium]|nr:phosphoribosylformylglycinamidine synthase subunit PurL [Planctomycetota bacterium]
MAATALSSSSTRSTTLPDAWRVEVFRKDGIDDPEGNHLLAAVRELGAAKLERARAGRGFLLPATLTRAAVDAIVRELFADPVLDLPRIVAPKTAPERTDARVQRVLVAKKPGVMDPIALTVRRALHRTGLAPDARADDFLVTTFRAWELVGTERLARETLAEIGRRVLANETIEDLSIEEEGLAFTRPAARPRHGVVPCRCATRGDERLLAISREGALSLNLVEMRAIQAHYRAQKRAPTTAELETLAQTWSEHCKHKTVTGVVEMDGERIENLLKQTIKAATLELAKPWCVSVFHDNAGVVEFDQGFDLCIKVETHNHPSAIDPYGGAGTGAGGVIRDVLGVGLGAKPIANTDCFFVGPPDLAREDVPKGAMHPRRILRGVVAGVRDYGNRMGIPTVNGGVWFHPAYTTNPLVYCGTIGLMPHWAATKEVKPGDAIVVAGGRTGRDGIHGATFSSIELSEDSETVSSAAVQIGDAITEKRVLDALLQARDKQLYRAITDCGAGGLSSAVGEMGEHTGAEVELEQVPLKYPGLQPEEIWISEAQERMVLAVPQEHVKELLALFDQEDVEATVIGTFTGTGRLVIRSAGECVADLDMRFLHEGTPKPVRKAAWKAPQHADPGCPAPKSHAATLLALLSAPDIASKEWIVRQYDHEVQGMSVLKPFVGVQMDGPGDATVLQPLATSRKGVAIGCGASPRYGELDPGAMAEAVIDEALRNVVAVGGDPDRTAILDNFSWGNCDKEDRLGALVLASKGCKRAALAYGTPFVSGKDSLNNEYRVGDTTLAIPPTLLITAMANVPDVARCVSMDLKRAGSRVYLVGRTRVELGGSHYLGLLGLAGGRAPRPDLAEAPQVLRALHRAIAAGTVLACHDLSEGGLAVAAAEMAFAGTLGLELDLAPIGIERAVGATENPRAGLDPDSVKLYAESSTRFLVEVAEGSANRFEELVRGLSVTRVGTVRDSARLVIRSGGPVPIVELDVEELRRAHRGGFQG